MAFKLLEMLLPERNFALSRNFFQENAEKGTKILLFPQDESEEPVAQPSFNDHHNSPPLIMQDLIDAPTRTVLVVDPSPAVRDLIQSILQKEHFQVIFANDDASVLTCIAAYHPHLLLLSVQLERMDGYQLCRMIRKQPHLARLPVILLGPRESATFGPIKGRLFGSNDFLLKPLDAHQLVQTVKKHLPE